MQFAVSVHRAAEDYLEAMLMMKERRGYIRSIDIAAELGVTKPSVSYATKRLRENGYITMDKEGLITLTESGMAIASRLVLVLRSHARIVWRRIWRSSCGVVSRRPICPWEGTLSGRGSGAA